MSERNPHSKRTRANVSVMPKDGGVFDLPHAIESNSVPAGQDAANDIDPAIQGNDFPVDGYASKSGKGFPVPLA